MVACSGGGPAAKGPIELPANRRAVALQDFDDCDDLLAYLHQQGAARVGPYGIPGLSPMGYMEGDVVATGAMSDGPITSIPGPITEGRPAVPKSADTASAAGGSETTEFSGTNDQEVGVDEPDQVKTDGKRIVTLEGDMLTIVDASAPAPVLLGSLKLEDELASGRLLLDGDRVLVLSTTGGGYLPFPVEGDRVFWPGGGDAELAEIDIHDPAHPAIAATLKTHGAVVDARQVGHQARIVVRSMPDQMGWVQPATSSTAAEDHAKQANLDVVNSSTIDDWLPHYTLERGGQTTKGRLVECAGMTHPTTFSSFGTVAVLTVDLAHGLQPGESVGILGDGSTVYSSTDNLYVTTTKWVDPGTIEEPTDGPDGAPATTVPKEDPDGPKFTTEIHEFSIAAPGAAQYVASGSVKGHLIGSYAMSESNGFLRIATTDGAPWNRSSESGIEVLQAQGQNLIPVGSVRGLGKGEEIQAVRYVGDAAYVVTFRQTDPLFTVDLSDPTHPRVAGQLDLTGFSAYLHPVGDGLLLGVGQAGNSDGLTGGVQVALFDVHDPANPVRLQQAVLAAGNAQVEWDTHAFLWWDKTKLAVLPVQLWGGGIIEDGPARKPIDPGQPFIGAVGFHVGTDGVTEVGRLSHAAHGTDETGAFPQIDRSLVIGDTLYTVSYAGIAASDLTTLAEHAFVAFPS
jgi:hypothetical protein